MNGLALFTLRVDERPVVGAYTWHAVYYRSDTHGELLGCIDFRYKKASEMRNILPGLGYTVRPWP